MVNLNSLESDLSDGIVAVQADPACGRLIIRPYRARRASAGQHQMLIILKPEVVAESAASGEFGLLRKILDRLLESGLVPGGVAVMSGDEVRRTNFVKQHYSLLNTVSHGGYGELRPGAARAVDGELSDFGAHRVVGGHELIRSNAEFSARALDILVQNLETRKLAAGVYASRARIDEENVLLLNAFHPAQVEHFERPEGAIVLIECMVASPLERFRREVVGQTSPADAAPASVRGWLFSERDRLGWKVSTSLNAIHASPSSVEAMFAISSYFGEGVPLQLAETALGARLYDEGISLDVVADLASNPDVTVSTTSGPIFDVTEDLGIEAAVAAVKVAVAGARSSGSR